MKKNKQVLAVINPGFNTTCGGFKDFLKYFPSRNPTWYDFDFEITDSIRNRKKSEYDFIVFMAEHHFPPAANYLPFLFVNEIERIRYKKILYFALEGGAVIDYNIVYNRLFKEWPYRDFEVFMIQKDFDHKNLHNAYVVFGSIFNGDVTNVLDYDFFTKDSPKKDKSLAVISSNASYAKGHQARINFSHKIKEVFQDKIDFYGKGFNPFANKYHTLSPYKYHIVLENGIEEGYMTEKLPECYLTECYPIYSGCPNIADYFDEDALTKIDVTDIDGSIKIINQVITDNLFEKKYDKIKEAKRRVLNEYNTFNLIRKYCLEVS
jgi:hypothetical protein